MRGARFRSLVRAHLAFTLFVGLLAPATVLSQRPRVVMAELTGAVDPGSG